MRDCTAIWRPCADDRMADTGSSGRVLRRSGRWAPPWLRHCGCRSAWRWPCWRRRCIPRSATRCCTAIRCAIAGVNAALVFLPLTLLVPYLRFRDTHLAHHRDAVLTDPYDDPESNYLDPRYGRGCRAGCCVPCCSSTTRWRGGCCSGRCWARSAFIAGDLRLLRAGDRAGLAGLAAASPGLRRCFGGWCWSRRCRSGPIAYRVYAALAVLKIRTFLEHQAHERARGRTVIIEDRGPLALMFLNNNLHVVHHMHPKVPWYRLPDALFRQPRALSEAQRAATVTHLMARYSGATSCAPRTRCRIRSGQSPEGIGRSPLLWVKNIPGGVRRTGGSAPL